jgi:hypothetical protein
MSFRSSRGFVTFPLGPGGMVLDHRAFLNVLRSERATGRRTVTPFYEVRTVLLVPLHERGILFRSFRRLGSLRGIVGPSSGAIVGRWRVAARIGVRCGGWRVARLRREGGWDLRLCRRGEPESPLDQPGEVVGHYVAASR